VLLADGRLVDDLTSPTADRVLDALSNADRGRSDKLRGLRKLGG